MVMVNNRGFQLLQLQHCGSLLLLLLPPSPRAVGQSAEVSLGFLVAMSNVSLAAVIIIIASVDVKVDSEF
jgi:hypothetical protein